jgi:hypothetical protein
VAAPAQRRVETVTTRTPTRSLRCQPYRIGIVSGMSFVFQGSRVARITSSTSRGERMPAAEPV